MKAYVCDRYGPPGVLKLSEVDKPIAKEDEILVKIRATAVTASDIFIRGSQVPLSLLIPLRLAIGILRPRRRVIGLVLSGEVEAVGKKIEHFAVGDEVYGITGFSLGCYAQYTCVREIDSIRGCLAPKPTSISHEEATAAAYGGLLGFQQIERAKPRAGQHVLVYGASSTTGTMVVPYLKHLGVQVTAVCGNANVDFVASLGADQVLDYTKADTPPEGATYDVFFDAVGKFKGSPLRRACRRALGPGGVAVSIDDGDMKLDSKRLGRVRDAIDAGHVRPYLDRIYPFDQLVEAHEYVGGLHKRGGVAIRVDH